MPSLPKTFTRPERTFSRTKDLTNHALTLTRKALRHTLTLLVPRYLPEEADTVWAKNHLGTQSLSCRYTQEEEAAAAATTMSENFSWWLLLQSWQKLSGPFSSSSYYFFALNRLTRMSVFLCSKNIDIFRKRMCSTYVQEFFITLSFLCRPKRMPKSSQFFTVLPKSLGLYNNLLY